MTTKRCRFSLEGASKSSILAFILLFNHLTAIAQGKEATRISFLIHYHHFFHFLFIAHIFSHLQISSNGRRIKNQPSINHEEIQTAILRALFCWFQQTLNKNTSQKMEIIKPLTFSVQILMCEDVH